jgi:hypothetical protein
VSPRDSGSATAELAVALPAIMLLLMAGTGAIVAVGTKLGCVAAARDAALAAARGADTAGGVTIQRSDELVTATTSRRLRLITITCTATALSEPGRS